MKRILVLLVSLAAVSLQACADENKLAFNDASVREVISTYQRLTEKKVIYDNTVQGAITLSLDTPVSTPKAIELIEKTLFANGFSFIDVSADTVEVIGLARNPRTLGVPVYVKQEDIPKSERVFTYAFKLQHRDSAEVSQLLAAQIAPSIYTCIVPDSKSGTVLVTERTSVIRGLLPVVAALDVAGAEQK